MPVQNLRSQSLKALRDTFSGDLGRTVIVCGSDLRFSNNSARVVFLDYNLGVVPGEQAVDNAIRMVSVVYEAYPGDDKPLVVLMSSESINDEEIGIFRDRAKALGGLFLFIHKSDLTNRDLLLINIGSLVKTIPNGYRIQKFVKALSDSFEDSWRRFIRDITALGIHDFAYIQALSLQADGQPLGDYMLQLFSSHFGHLLFGQDEVKKNREGIDQISFSVIPPVDKLPSPHLVEIYNNSLFDLTTTDTVHPRGGKADEMYLHLGDVFINENNKTSLMVLSADCDLAWTPDGKRKFKADRPILLIPGVLQPLVSEMNETERSKLRTELIRYHGMSYRIVWNLKGVSTCLHGSAQAHFEDYKLYGRLRLPYALEIQRAYAADFTRIGTSVPPPFYRPIKVQLFCESPSGKSEMIRESADGDAFAFLTRSGEHLVLRESFVASVHSDLGKVGEYLQAQISTLKSEIGALSKESGQSVAASELKKNVKRLEQRARVVNELRGNYESLIDLRGPFRIPRVGDIESVPRQPIAISKGRMISGVYDSSKPFILNLVDVDIPLNSDS